MIPGNIPLRGRMPTATQQREMQRTLNYLNNPVLSQNGYNTVSISPEGVAVRNYATERVLGKITGHGTGNRYSFVQVIQTDQTGTVAVLDGGVSGSTTDMSAYEMNGLTTVPTNAIVELVPTWGANPGYGFVYGGTSTSATGSLAEAAVHVTANLGTTPATYTVKRVERNGSGVLVESSPTVTYTAYEARNDQELVVDPTSTPTHEIPLFVDDNGNYYIELGQYAYGSDYDTAAPGAQYWPGMVSTTTQIFTGDKSFTNVVTAVQFVAENTALTHSTTVAPTAVSIDGTFIGMTTAGTGPTGRCDAGGVYVYNIQMYSITGSDTDSQYTLIEDFGDSWEVIAGIGATPDNGYLKLYHFGETGRTGQTQRLEIRNDYVYAVGTAYGLSATYTFGGGTTGDVASMTFTGGILTAVTLVP